MPKGINRLIKALEQSQEDPLGNVEKETAERMVALGLDYPSVSLDRAPQHVIVPKEIATVYVFGNNREELLAKLSRYDLNAAIYWEGNVGGVFARAVRPPGDITALRFALLRLLGVKSDMLKVFFDLSQFSARRKIFSSAFYQKVAEQDAERNVFPIMYWQSIPSLRSLFEEIERRTGLKPDGLFNIGSVPPLRNTGKQHGIRTILSAFSLFLSGAGIARIAASLHIAQSSVRSFLFDSRAWSPAAQREINKVRRDT